MTAAAQTAVSKAITITTITGCPPLIVRLGIVHPIISSSFVTVVVGMPKNGLGLLLLLPKAHGPLTGVARNRQSSFVRLPHFAVQEAVAALLQGLEASFRSHVQGGGSRAAIGFAAAAAAGERKLVFTATNTNEATTATAMLGVLHDVLQIGDFNRLVILLETVRRKLALASHLNQIAAPSRFALVQHQIIRTTLCLWSNVKKELFVEQILVRHLDFNFVAMFTEFEQKGGFRGRQRRAALRDRFLEAGPAAFGSVAHEHAGMSIVVVIAMIATAI